MNARTIRLLKTVIFVFLIFPSAGLLHAAFTDRLGSDPVAAITHYTGDWAIWCLIASLAITPFRRIWQNLGWLVRFRRMIGLFAFYYATLHLLTYLLLFSGFDLPGALVDLRGGHLVGIQQKWLEVWPTVTGDVAKRRFIQVGLLSWTILLALAVTSPQWVMRRMGGRVWSTLHKCVYGAAVLAVIHYWWLVKTGNWAPIRDTVVLALLLAARPIWLVLKGRNVRHAAAVVELPEG